MPIIKALIRIPVINKYINIFVDSGLFYLNNLVQKTRKSDYSIPCTKKVYFKTPRGTDRIAMANNQFIDSLTRIINEDNRIAKKQKLSLNYILNKKNK